MGHVIAFVPTSGGVGSTTLAAAVTVRAAAAGRGAVAVDLDRFSGRLDVVLGLEQEPGWRWPDLAGVAGVVDGRRLLDELPVLGTAAVLTWPTSCANGADVADAADGTALRLDDVDDWLERTYDVVAGLVEVADVVVLDCARDERVLAALADLVDVVVLVAGAGVSQVAAAGAAVPVVRAVLDGVRLGSGSAGSGVAGSSVVGVGAGTGAGLGATPAFPPIEPWLVLRGPRVDDELQDLLMDHLDVPVLGVVGDDRRLVADLAEGRAPGAGGRGPVVEMADRLLLRLVSTPAAA
ncbi:MAG: hypothetical protein JWP82_2596 [Humibacillus sp.]|nr:hypothetical protein [Humibacillus sp.]